MVAELLLHGRLLMRKNYALARARIEFAQDLRSRIYAHWLSEDRSDPFVPPFLVFSNAGHRDPDRLKFIYESTRIPPRSTWTSFDFLQPAELRPATAYTIQSNSLGARGAERKPSKTKGVFRIIALGAYHTFGHGVGDEQAFPSQLERILNKTAPKGEKYEVWNFGRHASTAIVGLAKMKFELSRYKPDMFLLDYGFVDPLIFSDNFVPTAMRFPDTPVASFVKRIARAAFPVLTRSLLIFELHSWLTARQYEKNTMLFFETTRAMISEARKMRASVILVRAFPLGITTAALRPLEADVAGIVNAGEAFSHFPPSQEDIAAHVKNPNSWTARVHPLIREYLIKSDHAAYKLNPLQLNAAGHRAIASELAKKISEVRRTARQHAAGCSGCR